MSTELYGWLIFAVVIAAPFFGPLLIWAITHRDS